MNTINHESFVNLYCKDQSIFESIFKDTKTLSQLSNKIIKASKNFEALAYKDADKVKGDLFEIFSECFFKVLSADNRIGVYNYQPAPPIDDYGVDGIAIGMDEKPLTIQVKFRSDATTELTQEHIKQFAFQSIVTYNVDKDTTTNMIVFTNAKGLHWVTESRVFSGRVKAIGYDQISQLVDNNTVFWRNVKDLIENTVTVKYSKL
jgi:hypothetical protein